MVLVHRQHKAVRIGALAVIAVALLCCHAYSGSVAEDALKKGLEYGRQGENDKAIAEFNKVIELDPASADAYYDRALTLYKMGSLDAAMADYNKVLELNPGAMDALYGRGLVYFKKNNTKQALNDFNKVIEMRPEFALAYSARAMVYFSKKDYGRTLADVNKAMALGFRLRPLKEAAPPILAVAPEPVKEVVIEPAKKAATESLKKTPGKSQAWKARRRSAKIKIYALTALAIICLATILKLLIKIRKAKTG